MSLPPLSETTLRRPHSGGRPQCWAAVSSNGDWAYERLEQPGTPWAVYYKPGTPSQELCPGLFGTLRAAREAVERGHVKPPSQWNAEHAAGQHDGRCGDCRPCQHDRGEHRSFPRTDCPTCTTTRPEGEA